MNTLLQPHAKITLPYKSVAIALLYSVVLGPLGLLYASFWGGVVMILLELVVICDHFLIASILVWVACSIWAVWATNRYNLILYKQERLG